MSNLMFLNQIRIIILVTDYGTERDALRLTDGRGNGCLIKVRSQSRRPGVSTVTVCTLIISGSGFGYSYS